MLRVATAVSCAVCLACVVACGGAGNQTPPARTRPGTRAVTSPPTEQTTAPPASRSSAPEPPPPAGPSQLAAARLAYLRGHWVRFTQGVSPDVTLPAPLMTLDIDDVSIVADGKTEWDYVADAESGPMLLECGPADGSVAMACIWKFDGERLVIAFGRDSYPSDFAVGPGRAAAVLTFSRDRSKPGNYGSPPAEPPPFKPPVLTPDPTPGSDTVPPREPLPPILSRPTGGVYVPPPAEKTVFVKGHFRNGKWVEPHMRSPPRRR